MTAKFTRKFDEAKTTRAIRLTDTAWRNLQNLATLQGKSRADLIERWARQNPYPDRTQLHTLAEEILSQVQVEHRGMTSLILTKFIESICTYPYSQ